MGFIALLIATAIISYLFAHAAKFMQSYYKMLGDQNNKQNTAIINQHPNWHSYLRFYLPIIITAFYFNAFVTAGAFVYFIVRWFNSD